MSPLALTLLILFSDMQNREDLKFAFSAEQGTDLSCGFSVLATFLAGYWDHPANERYLVGKYGNNGIVSIGNLLHVLAGEGFAAQAFRMDFAQLKKALGPYAPIIIHYDRPEGHFALLLEIRENSDMVVVSDPALGTMMYSKYDFLAAWSGAIIVARPLAQKPRGDNIDASSPALSGAPTDAMPRRANAGLLSAAVKAVLGRFEGVADSFKIDRLSASLP